MIQKAGGIITRTQNGITHWYVIHRPRYNDWSLPKGHMETGETPEQAALREVQEETGFRCRVIRPLPTYEYDVPSGERAQVWMFAFEPTGESTTKDEESDTGEWLTPEESIARITYPSLAAYLRRISTSSSS